MTDIREGQFWRDRKGRTLYVLEVGIVEVEDEMGVLKLMRVEDFGACVLLDSSEVVGDSIYNWRDE